MIRRWWSTATDDDRVEAVRDVRGLPHSQPVWGERHDNGDMEFNRRNALQEKWPAWARAVWNDSTYGPMIGGSK